MSANARASLLRAWTIDAPLVATHSKKASRMVTVPGDGRRLRVSTQDDGNWPKSTAQWCWYCCHPFDTQPLPMPIKYDDKRDVFHVMGTFCSWACMKAYNRESSSYTKSMNANNITLFRKRCTGCLGSIRPAPPRQALRVFGGTMGIHEFRAASQKALEYTVLPPHMIVHHHAIVETDTTKAPPTKQKTAPGVDLAAVVNFKDVATKNETLRLKRPKPLQSNRNALERTMGINIFMTQPGDDETRQTRPGA